MRIRYFNTLYKREDAYTLTNDSDINFVDGRVCFSWCGTKKAIEVEYIISIERVEMREDRA